MEHGCGSRKGLSREVPKGRPKPDDLVALCSMREKLFGCSCTCLEKERSTEGLASVAFLVWPRDPCPSCFLHLYRNRFLVGDVGCVRYVITKVMSVSIKRDRATGKNLGYGFVKMSSHQEAREAKDAMQV